MPFPYQNSATPVRTRKPLRERERDREKEKDRDRDTRSTTSSSSKKQREASRSSNRSPLPSSTRPASLYTQTNVTLDQLPALPRSETASPSSTRSPTLRASTGPPTSSTPLSSSTHPYTPAALQPYLETDDEDFDDAVTPQPSSSLQDKPYFDPDLVKGPSRPISTQKVSAPTATPPAALANETPSSQQPPTLSPTLSRVNTRSSDSTPSLQHPRPYHIPASSPTFSSTLPLFGGPPSEPYYPPFPPGPQYFPMAQAPTQPMDLQSLPPQNIHQPYASPPQMHASFNLLRNPPAREQSTTSSRMSFSGEPPPTMGPMSMMPAEPGPISESPAPNAPQGGEDDVFQRIQKAIPDLHLLLNRYRETSGQLGEREVTLRQSEVEKAKVLEQKDTYIETLRKEVHKASHEAKMENDRHAKEKDRLRLEIDNMTQKHNELQESLQVERRKGEEAESTSQTVRAEHAHLVKETQDEKAAMARDFEDWKMKASRDYEAKEKDFRTKETHYVERLEQQMRELDAAVQAKAVELAQKHQKDREKSELDWSLKKRELEDVSTRLRQDLNNAKDMHRKKDAEKDERHGQEKEGWDRERESLLKNWEDERARIGQGSEELVSHLRKENDDMQKAWKSTEESLKKERNDSENRLRSEVVGLKAARDADRADFSKKSVELKATANKLNTENVKLQKLADAFEQVTDLRGREDTYYSEAFEFLSKQIYELAQDFCSSCPPQIPNDVTKTIPPDLPPFLVDTPASALVRVAYIQSLVSDIITRRIFQHFLFTFDQFDSIFNEWAEYLRSKSTKREAIWRQRTLHAAFSCPSSKPRINKFAASIIDDIVNTIKPFVDRSRREQMIVAVKKIVKTAAETWRYARIELSRISASPAMDASRGQEGDMLLSIFPRITREPLPSDLRLDAKEDLGCVYSPGQTLSRHSPAVLARRMELGENVSKPAKIEPHQDVRHKTEMPGQTSSSSGSRARENPSRTAYPLIPPIRYLRKDTMQAFKEPDDSFKGAQNQQDEHATRWLTNATQPDDERVMGDVQARSERGDGNLQPSSATEHVRDHSADESPMQSPAPSRGQTPQLSRRSMVTTSSSAEEGEDSEGTMKQERLPDWGGAEGNIPGAFGSQEDEW
ncbi:MAG: hypothetical protein Q9181_002570 [Wetmoreana brouardii]